MERLAGDGPDATAAARRRTARSPICPFLAPSDSPEYLGRLGPYNVVGVIGQGGMGIVLKAHDPRLNRFVAIKVLAPQLAALRRRPQAIPARGPGRRRDEPRSHRDDPRRRRVQRVSVHRDGIRDGRFAGRANRTRQAARFEATRCGSASQIAVGLAAAARPWTDPSRHQARQHSSGTAWRESEDHRFRLGPSGGRGPDHADRADCRDAGVHVARAGPRPRSSIIAATCSAWGACCMRCAPGLSPFRSKTAWDAIGRVCNEQPRPLREINPQTPDWLS